MNRIEGTKALPDDWRAYIGDDIITLSINKGDHKAGGAVPKSCTELTDRVVAQAPFMLFANHSDVIINDNEENIPDTLQDCLFSQCEALRAETVHTPFAATFESAVLIANIVMDGSPDLKANEEKRLTLYVKGRRALGDELMNLTCRWWLPDSFEVVEGRNTAIITNKNSHDSGIATLNFTLKAGNTVEAVNRCVLELMPVGRATPLYVPVTFIG